MRIIGITAMALAISALPVAASAAGPNRNVLNQQGGLVNVNVTNVDLLKNFANGTEIEVLNGANVAVPVVVQAPISVAAAACGVAVNVLAKGGPSNNTCTATSGSNALTDLAIKQMQH